MAQPTATQQAQGSAPKAPEFVPDKHTYFLCQDWARIEQDLEIEMLSRYGGVEGRVVRELDVRRLSDRHTVVPVFIDTVSPVRVGEGANATYRRRKPDDKHPIVIGAPVRCKDISAEDDDTGTTTVQVRNLRDEDGRTRKGLLTLISDACMYKNTRNKNAATMRAMYRDDTFIVTLVNT